MLKMSQECEKAVNKAALLLTSSEQKVNLSYPFDGFYVTSATPEAPYLVYDSQALIGKPGKVFVVCESFLGAHRQK